MVAFSFFLVLLVCAFTNTVAWTIDLPEARHYYFSKYGNNKVDTKDVQLKDGEYVYNNINSNSKYAEDSPLYLKPGEKPENKEFNSTVEAERIQDNDTPLFSSRVNNGAEENVEDQMDPEKNNEEFEYHSYMEKKMHEVVLNGSKYLEGLKRAIEVYAAELENCTYTNPTTLLSEGRYSSCMEVTRKSEQVRRLSQLALQTVRTLQDRAYESQHPEHEDEYEDHSLLLRLAWFLDRLTELTGFEPNPGAHLTTPIPPLLSTPATLSHPVNLTSPPDVTLNMTRCLQSNDSSPATERCFYPLSIPDHLNQIYNNTGNPLPAPQQNQPNGPPVQPLDPAASSSNRHDNIQKPENLIDILKFPPKQLTAVKSVRKRSTPEHPAVSFVKYYAKFKAWSNVNPELGESVMQHDFQDDNDLRVISLQKRSVDLRVPEDPFQDIGAYLRDRAKQYLNPDKAQAERIKQYIEELHNERNNKVRRKRAVIQPKVPENPMQDISYYVKNRAGTIVFPNPVQAAQVRLGLERIYQTGNIEVVRRFGSNYNPLLVDQVTAGLLRSGADI